MGGTDANVGDVWYQARGIYYLAKVCEETLDDYSGLTVFLDSAYCHSYLYTANRVKGPFLFLRFHATLDGRRRL